MEAFRLKSHFPRLTQPGLLSQLARPALTPASLARLSPPQRGASPPFRLSPLPLLLLAPLLGLRARGLTSIALPC